MAAADDTDNFKTEFKRFKRRDRPLDLSDIVDVYDRTNNNTSQNTAFVEPAVPKLLPVDGLLPPTDWKIYSFSRHEGFYLIRNPFLAGYQRYWVYRCLVELPLPPNVTNLCVHPDVDPHTLWTDFAKSHNKCDRLSSTSALRKLRWTTIGYHYDWDTKEYREDNYTHFPDDISLLAKYVAATLGFQDFKAEAGIINYYHLDSTLGGHTDHSEQDHDAPLLSFSFGQDAIFLLGGQTKATKPTAIMLHSGDICVMSGASRLAYHAVPRVLTSQMQDALSCFELPSHGDSCVTDSGLTLQETEMRVSVGSQHEHPMPVSALAVSVVGDGINADHLTSVQKTGEQCLSGTQQGMGHPLENVHCECGKSQLLTVKETCDNDNQTDKAAVHRLKQEPGNILGQPQDNSCIDCHQGAGNCGDNASVSQEVVAGGYKKLVREVNERMSQTMKTIDWDPFCLYLCLSRINVNIRQVLKPGQTFSSASHLDVESTQSKRLCTHGKHV